MELQAKTRVKWKNSAGIEFKGIIVERDEEFDCIVVQDAEISGDPRLIVVVAIDKLTPLKCQCGAEESK